MLKETGYQEKIELLAFWLEEIVDIIKKDLKAEHLRVDKTFCKKYFFGKNPSHISAKEMAVAYQSDIAAGNVGLAEFIATRWLLRNTDIYGYFETKIKAITPDFEALEELPQELSISLVNESIAQFGAKKTYLFSVFNSVVFSPSLYAQLKAWAEKETEERRCAHAAEEKAESLEAMQQKHSREMAALSDRYEKKLSGMQKKYLQDTEALKKQIRALQKKLD
jgi:hypothetical protein